MKRYLLISLIIGVVLGLGAASNQVTINLTTSVPEILIHGFLKDGDTTEIYASTTEEDAFNPEGVEFTYAVKTNTSIPMTVYATVSPFLREDPTEPGMVNIEDIIVKGDDGGPGASASYTALEGNKKQYQLASFTPNKGGMAVYAYTLTVIARSEDVAEAPAGTYSTTVSIGITTDN